MALMEILVAGAPLLRQQAKKVTRFDKKLGKLLTNMAETMYKAEGCGLAAPQVGIPKRCMVIDAFDDQGIREFVNPEIISKEVKCVNAEGCLSVPEYEGEVERATKVMVKYQDRKGEEHLLEAEGLLAMAIQHEYDHLEGILFIDKALTLVPKPKDEEGKA